MLSGCAHFLNSNTCCAIQPLRAEAEGGPCPWPTGMIVITSGCGTFAPWAAALGGIVGGLIVLPGSMFVSHVCKVDDPVDAVITHMHHLPARLDRS